MGNEKKHKIMERPLPEILDGIEAVEEELRGGLLEIRAELEKSRRATAEAASAAVAAREAGIAAGGTAQKAAEAAVAQVKSFLAAEIAKQAGELAALRSQVTSEAEVNQAIVATAAKEHAERSPFLAK